MSNYKVRVNNEAKSKEVQELFFALGGTWGGVKTIQGWDNISQLYLQNGHITYSDDIDYFNNDPLEEITLPQLRDLVVLNRNCADDATHKYKGAYILKQNNGIYIFSNQAWVESCDLSDEDLEPIEKPMKEYLRKNNDGEYILEVTDEREAQEPHAKHWIEVPEGMNYAYKDDFNVHFTKLEMGYRDSILVWQRNKEELPDFKFEVPDPKGIDATLAERQATYGCFEDVARTTEQIMDALAKPRVNGLNELPYPHRMALYMIASKMARIVNGDFNHKDSWHDICGYAKLVEDLL